MEVQAPPGVTIGYVVQNWHPCVPKFTVQNEKKQDVLKIVGPCIICSLGGNIDFKVTNMIIVIGFPFLINRTYFAMSYSCIKGSSLYKYFKREIPWSEKYFLVQ